MFKELWRSIKEWSVAVPRKWWYMLGIPIAAIPLILGIVRLVMWARHVTPPLSNLNMGLIIGGALLFIILSFGAFHRMRLERDQLREKKSTEANIKSSLVKHRLAFDSAVSMADKLPDSMVVQVGMRFHNTSSEVIEFKVTQLTVTLDSKTVDNPKFLTTGGFIQPMQKRDYYFPGIKLAGSPEYVKGTLEYEVLYSSVPNTEWYKSIRKMLIELTFDKSRIRAVWRIQEESES